MTIWRSTVGKHTSTSQKLFLRDPLCHLTLLLFWVIMVDRQTYNSACQALVFLLDSYDPQVSVYRKTYTYCPRSDLMLPEKCPYVGAIRDYLKEEACKKRQRGENKEDYFDLTHKYLDWAWCIETFWGQATQRYWAGPSCKNILIISFLFIFFALLRPKQCKPRWLKKHWQKMSVLEAKF